MRDRQRVHQKSGPAGGVASVDSSLPNAWVIAIVYLALALTTLTIYWPVSQFEFVNWDDDAFVYLNPHVTGGLSLENFQWSFGIHGPGQWHPLAFWVHQLNCQVFGLNPGAHHMVSAALHVLVTLVMLTALWRISGSFWPSALVAALHALHPLSVESVAWIAHLREPLSLLFWLLVMWAYAAYTRQGGTARYLLVVVLFALGLMAKPTLITLPFVLLLLDWWPLNRIRFGANVDLQSVDLQNNEATPNYRSVGRLVLEKIPLLALSLVSVYLAYLCQKSMDAIVSLESHSLGARLANATQSYVLYLQHMVWPLNLATRYPLPDEFSAPQVIGSLLLLIGITVTALYFRRQAPHLLVGWLWYLGTLVPVIGILKMGAMTAMSDHYMYVSLLGVYIAIAWQLAMWARQSPKLKYIISGFVALTLVVLAPLTSQQIAVWRNSETLWTHTLSVDDESSIAHNNLGQVLLRSGRANEALGHFQDAVRIKPNYVEAHANAGNVMLSLGQPDEAISRYRTALAIAPRNAEVHYNCGVVFQQLKRWDEAIEHYEEALRIMPQLAVAHNNCGLALRALGRTQKAIDHFRQATQVDPNFVVAYINHGVDSRSLGRNTEAIEQFEQALRIEPENFAANYNYAIALQAVKRRAEALKRFETAAKLQPNNGGVHYGLAWIMATAPEDELRDGRRAIKHARRAVEFIKDNAFMFDALAAAHAEVQEFAKAVKWQEQAVEMAAGKGDSALKARLELYKQQLPYRQSK